MINTKRARTIAGAAAVAALAAGCKNFLSTDAAVNNPNVPTSATSQQRLTAVETNFTGIQTGDPARIIAVWMNQFAGTDRQYSVIAQYSFDEQTNDAVFSSIYTGGGIVDLRGIEQGSDAAGDSTTAGIARVLEAWEVGTAADLFGDSPYSTAFNPALPAKLDPQASLYAVAQTLLDRGIQQLKSNTGTGPLAADLFYGGARTQWTQAAYTLKARFYLHTAEAKGTAADGTPAFTASAYQSALAAAQNGISAPANDLRTYQSTAQTEANLLFQFAYQARPGYAAPNAFLVNLMTSRNDPRLTTYFSASAGSSTIVGSTTSGTTGGPAAGVAAFQSSTGIGASAYRWRLLSYAENQLIQAEANYRLGNTAAALTNYNNERTSVGFTTAATSLPAGAAGLQEIMTEKYIALIQNPEVWSDYRRTCFPQLTPVGGAGNLIPARFYYAYTERQTNPNIPQPSAQPPRNPNDPNPCFVGTQQTSN